MSPPRRFSSSFSCQSILLFLLLLPIFVMVAMAQAPAATTSMFDENFDVMYSQENLKTSPDGQMWYLYLHKANGCGFQTKQRYRFGWFSMKLKLVGGNSAGVVTAYYMCSDLGAGVERDELDFEFLGNRTGEPYIVQTNVYKGGVGNREMRHYLWFDPTLDFHTYSILWNNHHIVFFVDRVAIRVYANDENNSTSNAFFPNQKPMYMFSSIWNADDWATCGGLVKTNWTNAPFESTYKDFVAMGCAWPQDSGSPPCAATTGDFWWDQQQSWALSDDERMDFDWAGREFKVYDYCTDTERFPVPPPECALRATAAGS